MLVKSSLHSLLQLRDHLTSQLSGLKVADKPANASGDPADEKGAQQHRFVPTALITLINLDGHPHQVRSSTASCPPH